jgi:hypothetical protein
MQQAIMRRDPNQFLDELNRVLMDGWTIVPGSWSVQTTYEAATLTTPRQFCLPDGRSTRQHWFCVVESPPEPAMGQRGPISSMGHHTPQWMGDRWEFQQAPQQAQPQPSPVAQQQAPAQP